MSEVAEMAENLGNALEIAQGTTDQVEAAKEATNDDNIPKDNVTSSSAGTSSRVEESLAHDKKAATVSILCYVLLGIIGVLAFGYYVWRYADNERNQITSSKEEPIEEILVPFFAAGRDNWESISIVGLIDPEIGTLNEDAIQLRDFPSVDPKDFVYGPGVTEWTNVNDYSDIRNISLLVPPWGTTLKVGDFFGFLVKTQTDGGDPGDLSDLQADGTDNAIFWAADTVSLLGDTQSVRDVIDTYINIQSGFQVTVSATINFVQMSSFESINNIHPEENREFFEISTAASAFDQNSFGPYYDDRGTPQDTSDDLELDADEQVTTFYFFYDGTGGGVKTVLTTDRAVTFLDIFSNTGGFVSGAQGLLMLLLSFILGGFPLACCKLGGIAENQGLNKDMKKKVRLYLEEIGVIDDEMAKKIIAKE